MIPEIEEFAKMLIEHVRDYSIQSSELGLRTPAVSPVAKRWATAAGTQSPLKFAETVIPDVVDETVFHFLNAIDEGALRLTFTAANGTAIDLTKQGLGELAGWYMGSGGWREMYSKERFVDDLPTCAEIIPELPAMNTPFRDSQKRTKRL